MKRLQEMVVHEGDDYSEKEKEIKAAITFAINKVVGGTLAVDGQVCYGEGVVLVAETKVTYIGMAEGADHIVLPHFFVRVFTYDEKAHTFASSETTTGLGGFIEANIELDSDLKPVCEVALRVIHQEDN